MIRMRSLAATRETGASLRWSIVIVRPRWAGERDRAGIPRTLLNASRSPIP
jgi:hypothetical protein